MIKQEPRLDWRDLLAGLFVYFGFLLFLIALHIITIDSEGDIQSVLNTAFTIFVTLYSTACLFGLVAVIVQFLRWLAWSTSTPNWAKKKSRQK